MAEMKHLATGATRRWWMVMDEVRKSSEKEISGKLYRKCQKSCQFRQCQQLNYRLISTCALAIWTSTLHLSDQRHRIPRNDPILTATMGDAEVYVLQTMRECNWRHH